MEQIGVDEYKFRIEVMKKLTHLEVLVADLAGNGKPGRVGRLEHAVEKIQRWQSRQTGIVIGVSSAISVISAFIFYVLDLLKK